MCECIWREAVMDPSAAETCPDCAETIPTSLAPFHHCQPRSAETALAAYADAHAHEHAETCAKRDLREAALLAVDIEEQAIRLNRVLAAVLAVR